MTDSNQKPESKILVINLIKKTQIEYIMIIIINIVRLFLSVAFVLPEPISKSCKNLTDYLIYLSYQEVLGSMIGV